METPIQTLQNQTKLQGRYTIIGVLGKGGFGITYLAMHDSLHKKVAIKELFMSTQTMYCTRNEADTRSVMPHFSGFETFKTKFLDEARTLAKFTGKKGIVQISDTFEENNTSYFVMDYIDGKSLKTILEEQGTLSEKQTTEYALQILNALSEVHKENILHRDLKPDNLILRTADKQMMLIDFGIAREYAEDETKTQTAMMTVGFAPPEQKLLKAKRGAYTDLYSVGAVLYYCLTHQRPQTTDEISMDGYVSAKSINPAISVAMNTLIDKALTKPSAGRFQTCEEMMAALQNLHSTAKVTDATDIHETIIEATVETPKNPFVEKYKQQPTEQKSNRTPVYIGVGVAVLLVLGLVLWQPWAKKTETNEQASTTTETPVNVDTAAILATQAQKEKEEQTKLLAQVEKESQDNIAKTSKQNLLGEHNMTLQWISEETPGKISFWEQDNKILVKGFQKSPVNNDFLKVEGEVLKIIDARNFIFEGLIVYSVHHIQGGNQCIRKGKFTFRVSGQRKYWRMKENYNNCGGVTDYVDIYFK